MRGRRRTCIAIASSTILAAACAGNGEGLDSSGRPIGSGPPDGGPLTADFDSIQAHVLTPACTSCHAGASAPQGLRLDAGNSYDLLVGVPSTEQPSLLRVEPGDPGGSYLVQKLEGSASVGARMPLGGPYLDQATIDVMRQWITDGAQRSPAAAADSPGSFDLATTFPADGARLAVAEARGPFVVAFTGELDQTRIGPATAILERIGAPDEAQRVAIDVAVSAANPRAMLVTARADLAPGRYVLRLATRDLAHVGGMPLAHADGAPDSSLFIRFDVGRSR